MSKWSIKPAPSSKDPLRHVLFIKGDMKDVFAVVRKFGSVCGRPDSIKDGDYDFKLFLNKLSAEALETVKVFLGSLEASAPAAESAAVQPPAAEPPAAPPPPPPPPAPAEVPEIPVIAPAPAFEMPPIAPLAAPPVEAPAPAPFEMPALAAPAEPSAAPAVEAAAPFSLEPPAVEPAAPELIALTPEPAAAPPPEPAAPPPPPPPPPAPVPAAGPPMAVPGAAAASSRLDVPIDPKKNFEALLVGSFNRFAHAAAASVVGAPGSMYNPLFIHGAPGVGKSHMLEAIGGGLGKALTPEAVAMTTGARLSSMVGRAASGGSLAELENFFQSKKALLIDDIHLLSISDANQAPLAKILAMFLGRNLQVVLTSLYPPRALGSLEDALKISFAKGWSVDMKIPGPDVQKEMIVAALTRYGMDVNNDELALIHERLGANYFESLRWLRRLAAIKKIYAAASQPCEIRSLIDTVFEPVVDGIPAQADLAAVEKFVPPAAQSGARALAVLFPKGQEAMAPWLSAKFYEALSKLNVSASFTHVLTTAYDAEQPFGVPFQIGELCRDAGASAALILGPSASSKIFERVSEFSHAVGHILGGLDIAMGWIAYPSLKAAPPYTQAALDILAPGVLEKKNGA